MESPTSGTAAAIDEPGRKVRWMGNSRVNDPLYLRVGRRRTSHRFVEINCRGHDCATSGASTAIGRRARAEPDRRANCDCDIQSGANATADPCSEGG
jgi:hypothetical protein